MVQRVNLSKLSFGPYTFGNAAASVDSKGVVGGTFSIKGPNAPSAPTGVVGLTLDGTGGAHIVLAGNGNEVDCQGTHQDDGQTVRILKPQITKMKIGGNEVVPSEV